MKYNVQIGSKEFPVTVHKTESGFSVEVGKKVFSFSSLYSSHPSSWNLIHEKEPLSIQSEIQENQILFWVKGEKTVAQVHEAMGSKASRLSRTGRAAIKGKTKITSLMPGLVKKIKINVGDSVAKGQGLLVIEAMKMENEIVSPHDGIVENIYVKENQTVEGNDLLIGVKKK